MMCKDGDLKKKKKGRLQFESVKIFLVKWKKYGVY